MEDDRRDNGLYLSSYPSSTTASTTATTTATSTTMPSPDCGRGGKPKKGLKRFPRVIKAILFETSLAKKIRKRKNAQKGGGGNIYLTTPGDADPTKPVSGEQEPSSISNGVVELTPALLNPSTPSLTTGGGAVSSSVSSSSTALSNSTFGSSSSNSSSTNSRSSTANTLPLDVPAGEIILLQQQDQPSDGKGSPSAAAAAAAAGRGRYSSNVGLCLILVSLVVLVFWGKICAIIFTSTWLFFVPRCIPGTAGLSRIGAYYRRIEPEEYKKKVVMEGFLERNRNRARRWVGGLKGRRGSHDE